MTANRKSEHRSLTARGAATRSRIVEAAADLIYAHGVERTSLDDVMAASGVSKSQLYHYFVDKDALVLDVIAIQTQRILNAQHPHLEALDSLTSLKAWRNTMVRLGKAAQGKGCPLGSLASEGRMRFSATRFAKPAMPVCSARKISPMPPAASERMS